MSLLIKGITKLSQLAIDTAKNWGGLKIENLGAPDSGDDAKRHDSAPAGHNQATSTITSGQFPLVRMPRGTDTHVLTGKGAGVDPAYEAPAGGAATKEFTVKMTDTTMASVGDFWGRNIDSTGEPAFTSFQVPADFTSIVSAIVYGIVKGAAEGTGFPMRLDIFSDYGALDEAYNTHSTRQSNKDSVEGHSTINDFISWDLSGILGSLSAGDIVGIKCVYEGASAGSKNATDALIVGIKFKYS